MRILRAKSERLTSYLEWLLARHAGGPRGFTQITPADPARRGAQLSFRVDGAAGAAEGPVGTRRRHRPSGARRAAVRARAPVQLVPRRVARRAALRRAAGGLTKMRDSSAHPPRRTWDVSPPLTAEIAVFPGDTPLRRTVLLRREDGESITLSTLRATVAPRRPRRRAAPLRHGRAVDRRGSARTAARPLPRGPARLRRRRAAGGSRPAALAEALARAADEPGARPACHRASSSRREAIPIPPAGRRSSWRSSRRRSSDLAADGVRTVGIDTPSVDPAASKDLPAHAAFLRHDMTILEGLVLEGCRRATTSSSRCPCGSWGSTRARCGRSCGSCRGGLRRRPRCRARLSALVAGAQHLLDAHELVARASFGLAPGHLGRVDARPVLEGHHPDAALLRSTAAGRRDRGRRRAPRAPARLRSSTARSRRRRACSCR